MVSHHGVAHHDSKSPSVWLVSVEEGLKWKDQHSVPRAFADGSQTRLTRCKDASALLHDTGTLVIYHMLCK